MTVATESQWRAVIQAMAEAAREADRRIVLEVWPNGTGRLTGGQAIEEWNEEDCAVSAMRFGIPIAPDPPAGEPAAPECARSTFPTMYLADISGIIRNGQNGGDIPFITWHAFRLCDQLAADGHNEAAERLRRIVRGEGAIIRLQNADDAAAVPEPPVVGTVKTHFVPEGPAQPLPFPEEPYAEDYEPHIGPRTRAQLLAQFTAAALTGFASCPEHYTRDEAARRAVETAQTALPAFEAATRDLAEKGGE